jgi:RES domain-containing protein
MKRRPPALRFTGLVYRAHNPRWSYLPTSGAGAARHGGRFNRPGAPALYTALDVKTAWLEAQQGMPFKAQPLTLVAYRLDCTPVAELTDPAGLATAGIDAGDLACPWEDLSSRGLDPPSWRLAEALIAAGFHGALVPSFAPGPLAQARPLEPPAARPARRPALPLPAAISCSGPGRISRRAAFGSSTTSAACRQMARPGVEPRPARPVTVHRAGSDRHPVAGVSPQIPARCRRPDTAPGAAAGTACVSSPRATKQAQASPWGAHSSSASRARTGLS